MANHLASITDLGKDLEERKDTKVKEDSPVDSNTEKSPEVPGTEPEPRKRRGRKPVGKNGTRGISTNSPTVYLLPEEKTYLKRLEAHILLEKGENITDHQLIMNAVREYAKKHHPNYQ